MELKLNTPAWAVPLIGDYRYKGARGGRGSGKSHFFAEELVARCAAYPDDSAVCIRETQKSLKDSSKRLIETKIREMGLSHLFEITQAEIRHKHGSGIIIFTGMQSHNADSIKSLEGFKIAWVEEAQSISERSLRLLRPTLRAKGSQLWFSWNPEDEEDPIEVLFADADNDDNMMVVTVNWNNNPYFGEELIEEMERDKRIYAQAMQMWRHIWEGQFLTDDMGEVFVWSWFKRYDETPDKEPDMVVHSWDTAYKTQDHNDPSACTIWEIYGDNAYLVHVVNEKMEYPNLKRKVKFLSLLYPPDAILIEDKSSGQALVQELREDAAGLNIVPIMPNGDKIARASASTGKIEAGFIHVPSDAEWLHSYKKQLTKFSFDKELQKKHNDDMVDATSQFINWWSGENSGNWNKKMQELYGL